MLALAIQEGILAHGQDEAIQKHLLTFVPQAYKPEPPSASSATPTAAASSGDTMDVDSTEPKAEADKDVKSAAAPAAVSKPAHRQPEAQPELVAYLRLLTLVHLA